MERPKGTLFHGTSRNRQSQSMKVRKVFGQSGSGRTSAAEKRKGWIREHRPLSGVGDENREQVVRTGTYEAGRSGEGQSLNRWGRGGKKNTRSERAVKKAELWAAGENAKGKGVGSHRRGLGPGGDGPKTMKEIGDGQKKNDPQR